jgi:transcription termination factor Rho
VANFNSQTFTFTVSRDLRRRVQHRFKGTGNMELVLDRNLANQRIWPALNIAESGTRTEEKFLDARFLAAVSAIRRHLVQMPPVGAMKNMLEVLGKHQNNQALFSMGTILLAAAPRPASST